MDDKEPNPARSDRALAQAKRFGGGTDLGSGVQNSILADRKSNHRAEPWSAKIEF